MFSVENLFCEICKKDFLKLVLKKLKIYSLKIQVKMRTKIFFLAAMTAVLDANAQETMWVDGHECVDLGLSVLWATCNVGAEKPEDVGNYFNLADRADSKIWSENWRMPKEEELNELIKNCYSQWTDDYNGIKGYIFFKKKTGENYDVNFDTHIFLPAAGWSDLKWTKTKGYYCCIENTGHLTFSDTQRVFIERINSPNDDSKGQTFPIRAVCEKSAYTKLNFVEKDNANTIYKTFENGQVIIIKNGVKYNLAGQRL